MNSKLNDQKSLFDLEQELNNKYTALANGKLITVYQDPLTRRMPEGKATIKTVFIHTYRNLTKTLRAVVQFEDGTKVERLISLNDLIY